MSKINYRKMNHKIGRFALLLLSLSATTIIFAQHKKAPATMEEKMKRPSPPAEVKTILKNGTEVTINYSRPSLKGRVPGKDIEPFDNKIWRAGANEATTFEVNKDVKIDGKALPAGKYAFFTLKNGAEWTLIFNKEWNTWGAFDYEKNKAADVLQVKVKGHTLKTSQETLTYNISPKGIVSLHWGNG